MINLQIGPLALPLNPLLMLAGWWLASAVADRLLKPRPADVRRMGARALTLAAVAGLLAARIGFIATAWPTYAANPLSIIDVRDGGWLPWAGAATAAGVLAGFAWRWRAIAKPVAVGAASGFVLWAAATTALGVHDDPPLPRLSLPPIDGGAPVPLHAGDGRPTVINIWATWCAPCRIEMPHLAKAQQQNPNVRFVFVNHGENPAAARLWLEAQPYRLVNVLSDARMQLASAVGTSGLPTTLFIDAQGRIVERHMGPLSEASLVGKMKGLGEGGRAP